MIKRIQTRTRLNLKLKLMAVFIFTIEHIQSACVKMNSVLPQGLIFTTATNKIPLMLENDIYSLSFYFKLDFTSDHNSMTILSLFTYSGE